MAFSYDNLWNLIKERNISREELRYKIKASQTTIVKMGKNENVSLDVIDRICQTLKCTPNDIMTYIPEEKPVFETSQMKRGDIYLANLSGNSEDTTALRPYLIFENDKLICDSSATSVMAIPFSSNTLAHYEYGDIVIAPTEDNQLPKQSILQCNRLQRLRKINCLVKLGSLSKMEMEKVEHACSYFLGFTDELSSDLLPQLQQSQQMILDDFNISNKP